MKTNKLLLATAIAVSFATANFVQAANSDSMNQNAVSPAMNENTRDNTLRDGSYRNNPASDNNSYRNNSDQYKNRNLRSARTDANDYSYQSENQVGYSATCHGITASPKVHEAMKESNFWRNFHNSNM
jgi:hypothetical protein